MSGIESENRPRQQNRAHGVTQDTRHLHLASARRWLGRKVSQPRRPG